MKMKSLLWVIGSAAILATFGFQDGLARERSKETGALKDALEGKEPPPLTATSFLNTDKRQIEWKDFAGKVVLIDFWTQWCGPCKASVPHLRELYKKYELQGLVIVGVHSDPDVAKMKAVVADLGMTWIIAQDGEKKTLKAMHADSFPDYYLIDRKGKLRFADLANKEVDRAVEMLLKEGS